MIAGIIELVYVWWEGQSGWISVLSTNNNWPANTPISLAFKMKNTGTQSAMFSVSFMDLTSAGVLLNAGESAWVYLYPTTPAPGEYTYAMVLRGDAQVLATMQVKVSIAGPVGAAEFRKLSCSYSKV